MCGGNQNEISFIGAIYRLEESELCDYLLHPISRSHECRLMANTRRRSWLLERPVVFDSQNNSIHLHGQSKLQNEEVSLPNKQIQDLEKIFRVHVGTLRKYNCVTDGVQNS